MGLFFRRRIKLPETILNDLRFLPSKIYTRVFLRGYPFGMNGTDYIGTLSEYYLEKLKSRGIESFRMKAIGLPRFDLISELLIEDPGTDNFVSRKPTIRVLYPQSWGYAFGENIPNSVQSELDFLQAVNNHIKDYRVEISYRLRAEEKLLDYTEHMNNHPDIRFEEASKILTYESILNHDIIISTGSTMILEAIALSKYAILRDKTYADAFGFGRSGACLVGGESKEIAEAIKLIISDESQRSSLQNNANRFIIERAMIDGKSAARTVMFIELIIKKYKNRVIG